MVPLVFHDIYSQLDLPVRHRFPIEKYRRIRDALIDGGVDKAAFLAPELVSRHSLSTVFCPQYLQHLFAGTLPYHAMRRIGFPWSEQLIERTLTAVSGTVTTALLAYEEGLALNLTGGYHHAFYDYGSGFCLLNDLFLAAHQLLSQTECTRVLIFDTDVHQGDGTARLAQGRDDIITVSLHGEKNFPYRKQLSDMDFPLAKHTTDDEFLTTVEQALMLSIHHYQPDIIIYDAGVDVHVDDDLGLLDVSTDGLYQRDKLVLSTCAKHGVPVACVIGGGYQRNYPALVECHLQLYRAAGVLGD